MLYAVFFYCVLYYADGQNASKEGNIKSIDYRFLKVNSEFNDNITSNRVTNFDNKIFDKFPSTGHQAKKKLKNGHTSATPIYLDEEWNVKLTEKKDSVPPLMMELFEAMDNGTVQLTKKSETIRCFYGTKHAREEILFFNVSSIRTHEEIVDSELVIPSSFLNGTNGFYRDTIIRLYQILPNVNTDFNKTINADQHQLLTVSYVNVIKTSNQIFKMKQAVINWVKGAPNLGLLITVSDINDNTQLLRLTISDKQLKNSDPFLICYFKGNSRKELARNINLNNAENNIIETKGDSCNKKPLFINFEEIGWSNFIIEPRGFMANICSGTCSLGSPNFINYVKLLNGLRILEHVNCVPDQLDFLTLMFYDSSYNIVIKKYRNMIVRTCVCK
ncbi:bone morphogenetic protein 2 isoform X2 [Agrilus planipennis]|uniref:Bone morphogenetic protein 2 isoform X2 n=1 Tax=Agrilus planipennis TaxID=224129 RepID=A0A1W4X4Y3_AGRPL|nr:bone morphogenetic protein 2 isoform X2 [Agrilus planipennis]